MIVKDPVVRVIHCFVCARVFRCLVFGSELEQNLTFIKIFETADPCENFRRNPQFLRWKLMCCRVFCGRNWCMGAVF